MPSYKVVQADLRTDRATILDVLVRNEPDMPRPADQVAWHLYQNPHGEGRAWLLLTEPGGKPIGTTALVLRRTQVKGEVHLSGRCWGVSVDKEHRTLGPALLLAKAVLGELDRDLSWLFVLPYMKTAATLFGRAGYKKVGTLERHVRVLRSRHYLQNLSHHRALQHPVLQHPLLQRALSGPLVELLAAPADLGTWLAFDQPWLRPKDLVLTCVGGIDPRFDDLWARARSHYPVCAERTADFLAWRFRRSWDTHFTLGFARPGDEDRALAGYAMVTFHGHQAKIDDLFLEDPAALAPSALWLLIDWLRDRGFESISVALAGCAALRAELGRHWFVNTTKPKEAKGPRPRPGADAPPAVEAPPDELMVAPSKRHPDLLPDLPSWHFTLADDV